MTSGRFACPTAGVDLDQVLRRGRYVLWVALAVAVAVHVVAVGVDPFKRVLEKTPRPLTTRFIKRQPRLTKPLELRKLPKPQRQLLQRQVTLLAARMDQVRAAATFSTRGVLGQVASPAVGLDQAARFAALQLEPALQSELIGGTRQPESKIDLALEMLDINAMNTGRYRAMVIQDPADPQSLKGFVKVARVFSQQKAGGMHFDRAEMSRNLAIKALVDNLNRYTGIQAQFVDATTFDDSGIMEVPFVIYISIAKLTDREMLGLAEYLKAGGFILGLASPEGVLSEALEKYGGLVQGRDFHFGRVPDDHPIYRSFFDMGPGGVPLGFGGIPPFKKELGVATYLDGLWVDDRLAAVQGIDPGMFGYGVRSGGDTTRLLQLGVNILVFALTQEGSITQRLMQIVR
ncbi:MAG: DUF4159 domain-containing protein [Gemmatimonadota bacterium]